jgi:flagellar biosynthetic protein FlhB
MAEKTEAPSGRRLSEARARGQVMKSIEVNAALVLLIGTWLLQTSGKDLVKGFSDVLIRTMKSIDVPDVSLLWLQQTVYNDIGSIIIPLASILFGLMLVGVTATFIQVGFLWAGKRKVFDFSKFNILNGLKKLFSISGLFELLKSTLKICLIGFVAYGYLQENVFKLLTLCQMDFRSGISQWVELAAGLIIRVASFYFALAIADYLYQRWQFMRNMRMTKEEVKEEFKQAEGDPTIKGKIKEQQRRMARMRMMAAVPRADVIITNPTHLAVAVKYDSGAMEAPRVLAKGSQFVAQKIVEIGKQNKVAVVQNIQLARALYRNVEIDQEIPPDLYVSMAEVLAFVYKLKKQRY